MPDWVILVVIQPQLVPKAMIRMGTLTARQPRQDERRNYARNEHAPGFARMYVRVRLGEWGLRHVADPVQQVASELVANSVRHSDGENVMIWLTRTGTSVIVHAWDGSPVLPVVRNAGPDDENGRGLAIVGALAARTGSYPYAGGKVTWGEIML